MLNQIKLERIATRLEVATDFYLTAYAEGRPDAAIADYCSPYFAFFSAGEQLAVQQFASEVSDIVERFQTREVDIVRSWEDENRVFLHVLLSFNGGEEKLVSAVFFAFGDEDKISNIWSVEGAFTGKNPSGRTQVDGAKTVEDTHLTAQNAALAKSMIEECLFPEAEVEDVGRFFSEEYRQHNSNVLDGLEIVRKLAMSEHRPLIYSEITTIVAKGNFVAMLCKSSWEGEPLVQVDILRLKSGKIVEHWDLSEAVKTSH